MIGETIKRTISRLDTKRFSISKDAANGVEKYFIRGNDFSANITIEPKRWLSADLSVTEKSSSKTLEYSIDTDLYDISLPKYRGFAEEVEESINELLLALENKQVEVGKYKNKPTLIIPLKEDCLVVQKGIFTSTRHVNKDTCKEMLATKAFSTVGFSSSSLSDQ